MKLLLVEDDSDMAEMYRLQLTAAGYRVIVAADAQAALDALDDHKVQAIVLDIMLPVHNGINVLHELRSYRDLRTIPVLILSSLSATELGLSPAGLKRLGVVACLDKAHTKPQQLLKAVAAATATA